MDKALSLSFIKPGPVKVRVPNLGPKIDWATGDDARKIVSQTLLKTDLEYEKMRKVAVSLFSPLDNLLPSKVANVEKGIKSVLTSVEAKIISEPLYLMITAVINDTNYLGADPTERVMWYYHTLALIIGETGVNMNPKLEAKGTTVFQGKRLPYHVYGALQQTHANWDNAIVRFQDSAQGQILMKSGVIKELASFVRLPADHILDPASEFGSKYMSVYQTVPILGQMLGLKQSLNTQFHFVKDKGWLPKNEANLKSPNWLYIQKKYPLLFKNYYGGRQALLTMMHVNGAGFISLGSVGNHLDRIPLDVRTMAGLIGNTNLRKTISAINSTYGVFDKFARMLPHGDPTHTDPTETSVKKAESKKEIVVNSKYGSRVRNKKTEFHPGIDMLVYKRPVHAVADGKVVYAQFNNGGYGNLVKIKHPNQLYTWYAHMSQLNVKSGQEVTKDTQIGVSGNTGLHTGPSDKGYHLHFEVRRGPNWSDDAIDPQSDSSPFDYSGIVT